MTRFQALSASILVLVSAAPFAVAAGTASLEQPALQATANDDALASAVLGRIQSDNILRYHTGNLQVSARDGWVTLSGSVGRDSIRGRMDLVARRVKGVVRVVNLVVVEPKR